MKKIALFFDGTGNESDADKGEWTNVYKLWLGTTESSNQKKKYLSGVGTDRPYRAAVDQATGYGTAQRIREAYEFLCRHYNRQDGDQIYLFGFSRGALAARSLAGFADSVGLLLGSRLNQIQ